MNQSFDLNFTFSHTPRVLFGVDAISQLLDLLTEMKLERAVIVTDKFLAEKTDVVDRVTKQIRNRFAGTYSGVTPDPTTDCIDQGTEFARSVNADVLVSVGGGSAIDAAKGMAVTLKEGGKILDHEAYHVLTRPQTPHIAIPTTAGTGSEMTFVSVISDPVRKQKTFIGSYYLNPNAAILDPSLTVGMPPKLTAATGMDALSHAVESLISTLRQPFSDACAIGAIQMIAKYLPISVEQPNNLEARGNMLMAAAIAGTAFSNAMASLNHAMAHSLGARYHIHHGTANAILLPHTMRFFMDASAKEFATVGTAMGIDTSKLDDKTAGNLAADRIESLVKSIGIKDRLRDYGADKDSLMEVAEMAMTDGTVLYSPKELQNAQEIYQVMLQVL